ncbi:PAS domain S-box protein [bacterium]|nr:PAS domain S-box protein [bacterium]
MLVRREVLLRLGAVALAAALGAAPASAAPAGATVPRRLVVVDEDDAPPYLFRGSDGRLAGFTVDLWREWERVSGVSVDIQGGPWLEMQRAVLDGRAAVINGLNRSPARERLFDFGEPIDHIPARIFFDPRLGGLTSVEALRPFAVGVVAGDYAEEFLRSRGVQDLRLYPRYETLVAAFQRGEVRVFVAEEPIVAYAVFERGLEDRVRMSPPLYDSELRPAVRKGDEATLRLVADGFAKIPPERIAELRDRWRGEALKGSRLSVSAILWGLAALLAVAAALVAWNRVLRARVRAKTSELRAAMERLRESESASRLLVETAQDLICTLAADGTIVSVNAAARRVTGFGPEELVGRPISDFVHPDDVGLQERMLAQLLRGEAPLPYDLRLRRASADFANAEVSATPILRDGRTAGVVAVLRDITLRRRAEEALAAEKERLAVTLRSLGDGVVATDVAGRVLLVNRAAEELTGWPREEAEGHPLADVFAPLDERTREPAHDPLRALAKAGGASALSFRSLIAPRGGDGPDRLVEYSVAAVRDKRSNVVGAVLVFRDVTIKERLDAERRRNARLESVALLAGGVAHDFNNILTGVLGNLSLAEMALPEDVATAQERVAEAARAAARAQGLTRQLLTFAKGGSPVKRTLSIGELTRESAAFAVRGSQARCAFDLPADLWPADADAAQINQVLQNLVINAVQAMPQGGVIEISAANTVVDAADGLPLKEGRYVRLTVRDHGCGIPPEMQQRIFDPYFTTKKEGTGLGLATSYSIVRKHDGHVAVESAPGAGAAFHVYLPAAARTPIPVAGPVAAPACAPRRGCRVLVLDDDDAVRDVALQMLATLGFDGEAFADGAAAAEAFAAARAAGRGFAAAVLDLTVPAGLGAEETALRLRAIDPGARLVVTSGYATAPPMVDPAAHGFAAAIVKPYTPAELADVLERALSAAV